MNRHQLAFFYDERIFLHVLNIYDLLLPCVKHFLLGAFLFYNCHVISLNLKLEVDGKHEVASALDEEINQHNSLSCKVYLNTFSN